MKTTAMKVLSALIVVSGGYFSQLTMAQEQAASEEKIQKTEQSASEQQTGSSVRRLLDLQRSGEQASENRQYVSGAEMQRIYQRYLDSFEHPVPELFIKNEFSAE